MSDKTAEADKAEIFTSDDPIALFREWMELARAREPEDANAFALATADKSGLPDVRMVLLKDVDARGFVF
jgi:pyridoxamine 5'-phosphate oxidase